MVVFIYMSKESYCDSVKALVDSRSAFVQHRLMFCIYLDYWSNKGSLGVFFDRIELYFCCYPIPPAFKGKE